MKKIISVALFVALVALTAVPVALAGGSGFPETEYKSTIPVDNYFLRGTDLRNQEETVRNLVKLCVAGGRWVAGWNVDLVMEDDSNKIISMSITLRCIK